MADTAELSATLHRMRTAQARDPLPSWQVRADRLERLGRMLSEQRATFAAAIDADFGQRPVEETELLELFPSLSAIRHALRHGRRWMRARRAPTALAFLPGHNRLLPQPRGVVGIVVPWNYPLFLAVGPLVDALVAGNRAMVKMSEFTPGFSALLAEQVSTYFTDEEVVVVTGDAAVAQAFTGLAFDHLLFTGSTAVGRQVMRTASAHLTPVTLELGGKSPAIIGPGADMAQAVERILVGKLVNAGQTCIAPDYVLLPRARVDEFVAAARAIMARLYPDLAHNRQYASLISERHFNRMATLLDEARGAGARIEPLADTPTDPARRLFPPQLLLDVPDDAKVMHEEIFGPLLPLVACDSVAQAVDYANARPHPLALYLFERDQQTIEAVLARTRAGGVTVNDTLYHIAQHGLPFGGLGASGMGGYHGKAGFDTFSHLMPVFTQSRWNGAGLLRPPYGPRFRRLLELLLRHG